MPRSGGRTLADEKVPHDVKEVKGKADCQLRDKFRTRRLVAASRASSEQACVCKLFGYLEHASYHICGSRHGTELSAHFSQAVCHAAQLAPRTSAGITSKITAVSSEFIQTGLGSRRVAE